MTHPILELQGALVAALGADAGLVGLIGEDAVFDAPPRGGKPPYVTIARHDIAPRDGDLAPGHEHRVVLHVWAGAASRRAVVRLVERILAVALEAPLECALTLTHRRHERTETAIDKQTGLARAAVSLRFFTEA